MNEMTAKRPGPDAGRGLGAIRVLLIGVVFMTPVFFDLGAAKPFDYPKLATVWVLAWIAAGVYFARMIRAGFRPARSLMVVLAVCFLGASALATVLSSTRWTSLLGWYGRYDGLLTVLVMVLVFILIFNVYRDRADRLFELIWAVAASSMVMSIYIVMQAAKIDPFGWAKTTSRTASPLYGTMGNSNFAGGYLGLAAPWIYFAYMNARSRRQRILIGLAGLVHLLAMTATFARNGLVAFLMVVLVLLYVNRSRVPRILKMAAAATIAVVVLLATVIILHPGSEESYSFATGASPLRSETLRLRGFWWLAGIKVFAHDPVIGTGPETFGLEYQKYLSPDAVQFRGAENADKPHSIIVEHLAETGLLGFGSYIALVIVAFRRGLRRIRELDGKDRLVLTTFLAMLGGYLGQGIFSIDVTAICLAGWVALGAIAAMGDPGRSISGTSVTSRPLRSRSRTVMAGATLAVGALVAVTGLAPMVAEHDLQQANRIKAEFEPFDSVASKFRSAIAWDPVDPVYRGFYAAFLEVEARKLSEKEDRLPLFREATNQYKEMEALQPGFHRWAIAIARSTTRLATVGAARFSDAERMFKEAQMRSPFDWTVYDGYADLLRTWAVASNEPERFCRAIEKLNHALSFRVERAPLLALVDTYRRLDDFDKAEKVLLDATKRLSAFETRLRQQNDALLKDIRREKMKAGDVTPYRCD